MPWITAAAIVGSSLLSANQANKAAQTQSEAADKSIGLQERQYAENLKRQQPFYEAGVNALPELVKASRYTPFSMEQFTADPGYGFRLSEGQKALERSAAARGGLISGGALKAAQRYGQEMGSQEYTNAFNRYQAERQARLNPLQSLTGMGQTTANIIGNAGTTMAGNVGEAYMGGANARASGYVGMGNAINSGLSNYLGYQQQQQQNSLLNSYLNRNAGGPTTMPGYYGVSGADYMGR
jgi:hypothetical protein